MASIDRQKSSLRLEIGVENFCERPPPHPPPFFPGRASDAFLKDWALTSVLRNLSYKSLDISEDIKGEIRSGRSDLHVTMKIAAVLYLGSLVVYLIHRTREIRRNDGLLASKRQSI
jgi:hypothetical protein